MRPAVWVAAVLCCALGNVSDAVLVTGSGVHSHSILGLRIGSAAFAQPPTVSNVRMVGFPGCLRRGVQVCVRESLSVGFAGGSGGSVGGRGGSGGGPWDGHWDGGHGGGHRFNGLAYVATKGPRLTNRTVLEPETGVKFPPALLLNPKDKKPVRFLGAGCSSTRSWRTLFRKQNDYAMGLYIAPDDAYAVFKKNLTSKSIAEEALLTSFTDVTRTIRIVLTKETDTHLFTEKISDRIEAKLAKRSFGRGLSWLEIWRKWLVYQGGYYQKLPKGVEVRFTWAWDEYEDDDVLITEIRKRDRVLASKTCTCDDLAWAVFSAFLGDDPIIPSAKKDIIERLMNLCR